MIPLPAFLPGGARRRTGNRLRRTLALLAAGLAVAGLSLSLRAQTAAPSASAAASAAGASVDPAALTALRQRYRTILSEAGKPSQARWLAALEALEKQRITAGDFDGAARVRGKISALRPSSLGGAGESASSPPSSSGELARLKDVYQKQFTEQTRAVNARYLKNLTELEIQLALGRDTDTLALVRQEKKQVDRGGDEARQGPMTFVLPINDNLAATIRGEARLTSQKDFLVRLRPAGGCEIIWKLTRLGIPPGRYSVRVECRLTEETGGSASLFSMPGGGSPGPALTLTIPASGEVPLTSFNPGMVTVGKGADHLVLRVTSLIKNDGSFCDLKSLSLTPAP